MEKVDWLRITGDEGERDPYYVLLTEDKDQFKLSIKDALEYANRLLKRRRVHFELKEY